MFKTIERNLSLTDRTERQIKQLIVDRSLRHGERLPPQDELAELIVGRSLGDGKVVPYDPFRQAAHYVYKLVSRQNGLISIRWCITDHLICSRPPWTTPTFQPTSRTVSLEAIWLFIGSALHRWPFPVCHVVPLALRVVARSGPPGHYSGLTTP